MMNRRNLKWLGVSALWVAGFLLLAPPAFAASGSGYSATCKDGTAWTGSTKRGACRGHKGVASWTSEGGAASAESSKPAKAKHERESRRSKSAEETASAPAPSAESASTRHEHKSRRSKKTQEAAAAPAAPTAEAPAAGAMTATCRDGSAWSGKSKRGACRGHKGVASWGGEAAPAAAPQPQAAAAPQPAARTRSRTETTSGGSLGAPAPGGGAGRVWVNTESKTYHCQGSKWYGTTKHGEYMTEAQATAQGYHADHGRACTK